MEALADTVATTCPLAFNGVSGAVFLNAISAVVAAHCAIFDDYSWPADKAEEVLGRGGGEISYDYIVVGAGTAGSIVASSLADRYPNLSVLLVEAGEDPGVDCEVPAFLFNNRNSNSDWIYKSEPDEGSCLGLINNSCIWNKGKGMGGSSSINAMLYVRGHPRDFDDWNESGSGDWTYDNLKKYFELQENKFNIANVARTDEEGWYKVIDEAWKQLQFKSYKYDSHEGLIGTKKGYVLTENGKRLNTAKKVLEKTKNLNVIKNTIVRKVILDNKSNLVKGVSLKHSGGADMEIISKKEVILSAGSIGTPQILMLSGIGPKEHLEKNGIECKSDLPVGQNLQDHLIYPLLMKTKQHFTLTPQMMNLILVQYMLTRTGPMSGVGIADFFGFVNTKNSSDQPNLQFHHMYFSKNEEMTLRMFLGGTGYKSHIIEDIVALNKDQDIVGLYPTLLHPKSKGKVLLRDSSWDSKPIIQANYLQHPNDIETFIEATEFVHKLEQTDTFKHLGMEILQLNLPECSTFEYNTKPYWNCYIRHMATTVYHPVGTVKMGNDISSVVDYNLLVHGFKNLRVVDASIMPSIPGGNTMAATLAIAHKAVDLITKANSIKEEL